MRPIICYDKQLILYYNYIMTIEDSARIFATAAHAAVQQKRKYTDADYIVHPAEVVDILKTYSSVPPTQEQIAAAWLHDVCEDCNIKPELIGEVFGDVIASYVVWLTDVSKPTDGVRDIRKAIDREHTALAPAAVKTVKLADLCSNSADIVVNAPGFARSKYLPEKEKLLEVLKDGDPGLHARATYLLEEGWKKLGGKRI